MTRRPPPRFAGTEHTIPRFIPLLIALALLGKAAAADDYEADLLERRIAALEAENAALREQGIAFRTLAELHAMIMLAPGPADRTGIPRNLLAILDLNDEDEKRIEQAVSEARRAQALLIAAQAPKAEDDGRALRLVIHDLGQAGAEVRRGLQQRIDEIIGPDQTAALPCLRQVGAALRSGLGMGLLEPGDSTFVFTPNAGAFDVHIQSQQSTWNATLGRFWPPVLIALKPYLPREFFQPPKDQDDGAKTKPKAEAAAAAPPDG